MLSAVSKKGIWLTDVFSKNCGSIYNEAPRSKLRGIKAKFAEANPPSLERTSARSPY
jgi:hypothetical protein